MNLSLYYYTLRSLKWQQIWYRLPLLKKIGRSVSKENLDWAKAGKIDGWVASIKSRNTYRKKNNFDFLNQSRAFLDKINWDCQEYGLLWAYNLNYFEFLEQEDMDERTGYYLIDDFLNQYQNIKIGHDPYPLSLRLIFLIRFFIRQPQFPQETYLNALHQQAKELQAKLEYHLLGNHLLENAFALYFTGSYLGDISMIKGSKKLLHKQLKEQILPDGGHFELSPMYHQLMFYRLLDCINIGRACAVEEAKEILPFLETTARKMYSWMQQMAFGDGSFPLFNDAAYGIAPPLEEISDYANRLNIAPQFLALKESGYRKWEEENWELIMDVGQPGPSYQPGHAHCDALSFVLQINNKPVIVDTGTSVYGGNPKTRQAERTTAAHNTVQYNALEQSEIWGEFRMGRKAEVKIKKESSNEVAALLKGFYPNKQVHFRSFKKLSSSSFRIEDRLHKKRNEIDIKTKAHLHFHPSIPFQITSPNSVSFDQGTIIFEGAFDLKKEKFKYAPQFGKTLVSSKLVVTFLDVLNTKIVLQQKDNQS